MKAELWSGREGAGSRYVTHPVFSLSCFSLLSCRLFSKKEEKRLKVHQLSVPLGCLTSVLCSSLSMVKLKAGVKLIFPRCDSKYFIPYRESDQNHRWIERLVQFPSYV